jgi:diacylglycerol O-acyltransferase
MTEMLRGVIASQASKVVHIVRGLPSTVGTLEGRGQRRGGPRAAARRQKGPGNLTLAPRTPFNVSVTEGRAFASVSRCRCAR